ncbi:MAG: GHKL domain-containing protein [Ekhidna sp.]|nr:GHKL domain-containing protein [Ekhidna sp.]
MAFRKGLLFIILRVLVLVALILGTTYAYAETDLIITPLMLALFSLISISELIWYLDRQQRSWIRFLESIKYQDFNRVYHKQISKELGLAYEMITEEMEKLQSNNRAEYKLLETVLGHVSVGIACYQDDGSIVFSNKSFKDLLNIPALISVDKLLESHPKIYEVLTQPQPHSSGWVDHEGGQKLLVRTEPFKLKQVNHTLVSLTDIRNSLDTKELESFQRLMRVMTHEIMNSANPILSLIQVVNKKLIKGHQLIDLPEKDQSKVAISLEAIEERTSGILRFVNAYKEISKPIQTRLETISSQGLLSGIEELVDVRGAMNLTITNRLEAELKVDPALIRQVLINLIKNAKEALTNIENGHIELVLEQVKDEIHLTVRDNGPGVEIAQVSQIFIPFFTTKLDGSGIGLALSRKIVKAHGGYLEYRRENDLSNFTIRLPAVKH